MLKKTVTIVIFFLIALTSLSYLPVNKVLAADGSYGLDASAGEISAFKGQSIQDDFIQTKAGQIIGVLLSFVGVLFLILMIYAGLMWMTAQGNSQKVDKAKELLINSIIGIIIIFSAYALTAFIGNFVSNQLLKK